MAPPVRPPPPASQDRPVTVDQLLDEARSKAPSQAAADPPPLPPAAPAVESHDERPICAICQDNVSSDPSGLFPPPHSLELRDATSLQISETKMLTPFSGSSQWWFRIRYFGPPKNPLISGAGIIVGGDFKRFLFSPVVGEDFQLDLFLRWVETSN